LASEFFSYLYRLKKASGVTEFDEYFKQGEAGCRGIGWGNYGVNLQRSDEGQAAILKAI